MGSNCFKDADNYVRQVDEDENGAGHNAQRRGSGNCGEEQNAERVAALRKLTDSEIGANPHLRAAGQRQRKRDRLVETCVTQMYRLEGRIRRRRPGGGDGSNNGGYFGTRARKSGSRVAGGLDSSIEPLSVSGSRMQSISTRSAATKRRQLVGSPSRRKRAGIYAAEYVSSIKSLIKRGPSSSPVSPVGAPSRPRRAVPSSKVACANDSSRSGGDRWNGLSSGVQSDIEFSDAEDNIRPRANGAIRQRGSRPESVSGQAQRESLPYTDFTMVLTAEDEDYDGGKSTVAAATAGGLTARPMERRVPSEPPDRLASLPSQKRLSTKVRDFWSSLRSGGGGAGIRGSGDSSGTNSLASIGRSTSASSREFIRAPPPTVLTTVKTEAARNGGFVGATGQPNREWLQATDPNH